MSAEVKPGREATIRAQRVLEEALARAAPLAEQEALSFAAEQLRLQALMHVKTLGAHLNSAWLNRMAGAIKALEQRLPDTAPTPETEGPAYGLHDAR